MKKLTSLTAALCLALTASATAFEDIFDEVTLRIDLKFSGVGESSHFDLDSIAQWPGWYGRRVNIDRELYPEELQVLLLDTATGDTLYVDSKCPEAAPEEGMAGPSYVSMFVPRPKTDSQLKITHYSHEKGQRVPWCSVSHRLTGKMLEKELPDRGSANPYVTLHRAIDPRRAVNFAILSEGYTVAEMDTFLLRAQTLTDSILRQPGFSDYADRFNVVAVMLPSPESGITIPSQNKYYNSALRSHFDSYNTERLLTVPDTRKMWDAVEGIPASVILILANTDKYGGSGSYNEYAISAANIPHFTEVIIHELGHSFGWLGDEYEANYYPSYFPDVEPIEPNITTLHDFSGKWQNLIDSGEAGLIEGAGYQSKGVWRGCEHCLMRAIADARFCPVCAQALRRVIAHHTQPTTNYELLTTTAPRPARFPRFNRFPRFPRLKR